VWLRQRGWRHDLIARESERVHDNHRPTIDVPDLPFGTSERAHHGVESVEHCAAGKYEGHRMIYQFARPGNILVGDIQRRSRRAEYCMENIVDVFICGFKRPHRLIQQIVGVRPSCSRPDNNTPFNAFQENIGIEAIT